MRTIHSASLGLALAVGMSGCSKQPVVTQAPIPPSVAYISAPPAVQISPLDQLPKTQPRFTSAQTTLGTGVFVNPPRPALSAAPNLAGDPITLDYVNVDVRDVVRSVLGDVLKLPYAIDPASQGTVTLKSGSAISREEILPRLESALSLAGLALVESNGLYKVMPLAQAAHQGQLTQDAGTVFVAKLVTPRYAAAADLARLLEPLVPAGTIVRAEPSRNALIISGPASDVSSVLENLRVFDTDTLRGMSTALLPLKTAAAKDVAKDIQTMLASLGESGQLVRVVALEHMNAVLVTSMRPDYIERVRRFAAALDKTSDESARSIYVYRVQNGRAASLATVLRKTFGIGGSDADSTNTPSTQPATLQSASFGAAGTASPGTGASSNPLLGGLPGTEPAGHASSDVSQSASSQAENHAATIRITADDTNNALLILATQAEYTTIAAALRQLDIAPLQVMIEATLAEVTLTDQLNAGLQYYFKSGRFQALFAQTAAGGTASSPGGFSFASGLNAAFGSATGSSVILQLLQQLTNVRVISSPNLMVLNNQSARIQVGDQVPIATGSAVSTISTNAPIVNSIEYRDTGVILKITPRVNASGIVSLDIGEEVSSVSSTTSSSLNSPTISERRLDTTVSVADGQTIALGGLISDSQSRQKNGIPVLQNVPGLGWLFGQTANSGTRTELIAILTPHVVRNQDDARLITQELQSKLPLTIPLRAESK